MKLITDLDISSGTKVLVRYDIDVLTETPGSERIEINTFRLDAGLNTLKYILEKGGFPIICGHLGNPEEPNEKLSSKQLISYFEKNLGKNTFKLLENLKFNPGEKNNSETFAQKLAEEADIYVNESFATSHRTYASIVSVPKFLPSYAGVRLQQEVKVLTSVLQDPQRPLVAIIGGAKLESKKPTIEKFIEIADVVLVGGKLGLQWDNGTSNNLILPVDYAPEQKDIGPKTIEIFKEKLRDAKTVVWAGPLGLYEDPKFVAGTTETAYALANSSVYTVVGGGDTIAALQKLNLLEKMSFVSTGGGAMLTFLTEGNLPGLIALTSTQ